jgi:hypothetical protein
VIWPREQEQTVSSSSAYSPDLVLTPDYSASARLEALRGGAMTLTWSKCEGNKWCPFLTVNLDHPHFRSLEGIYINWHGGQTPWTVYVGQGAIADRLRAHRQEQGILQYSHLGLFVTWAQVDLGKRDGIELFLNSKLQPREGRRAPIAAQIEVNLPWS